MGIVSSEWIRAIGERALQERVHALLLSGPVRMQLCSLPFALWLSTM